MLRSCWFERIWNKKRKYIYDDLISKILDCKIDVNKDKIQGAYVDVFKVLI